jgi:hypothetical protein
MSAFRTPVAASVASFQRFRPGIAAEYIVVAVRLVLWFVLPGLALASSTR